MMQVMRPSAQLVALIASLCVSAGVCAASKMETGFLNRTVTVSGEAHRYQVFVPAEYEPTRRWPIILFLHGSGERGEDGLAPTEVGLGSALRRHAEWYPAIVVFPQAPSDVHWTGPGSEVALKALEQTEHEFNTDPERVYLTGLSMGGSGAWHLAYRDPGRYAALLVICARIEPSVQVTEQIVPFEDGPLYTALAGRLKSMPIWVFHGDADDVIPVEQARQISAALKALNAPVRYTELAGVGHNAWDAAYGSMEVAAWLLSQQRRARDGGP